MAKKDILFLCQFFYPEYVSSATLPYDTVMALKAAGYSVDVLCGYPREYLRGEQVPVSETHEGVHIKRLKYLQLDRKGTLGRLINYFSFTFMVLLQLGTMAKYSSVVVYSNPPILPWIASWARVLFGTRVVFVCYDVYPEMAVGTDSIRPGSLICRLMEHINSRVFPRTERVVALSSEMKEFLAANRKIAPEKITVIPNWFRDAHKENADPEENPFRQVTGGRFTVGYFGNMGTVQDMETIRDAIRLLRNDDGIFFLIVGHGNKMAKLQEDMAAEQIPNVKIMDFLHGQDYLNALGITDAALVCLAPGMKGLCVPSKTYGYMMDGIPLLAIMDEGDIVSDIESGAGMWVCNGESEALADAIRYLRDHPEECAAMRQKCRSLFLQKYETDICTAKYVDMFREILK